MSLTLVTAPVAEPLSTSEAKSHLRVDASTDDTLIGTLIVAARQHVEAFTRRVLITQTWDIVRNSFPPQSFIDLPLPPLQSVTSVKYKDQDGDESTMSSSDYIVDTAVEPGRIVLAWGASWPGVTLYPASPITVRFVAGYGDDADDVPQLVKQAMLMLIGHWYENREAVVVGSISKEIELATSNLLWPYRVFGWR